MSAISTGNYLKRDLRSMFAVRNNCISEETAFCKQDNLQQSLNTLNEEFESFGISSVTTNNDLQTLESLKDLSVQVINAAWKMIHKHRYLMRLHDQLIDLNHKTVNDNVNLKNHIKRLKEDIQKKEHMICKAEERERRLNVKCEDTSRNLKQERDEIRKLKKQIQFKETQHEHEIRRITQSSQKLQEQLQKSAGSFTPRDKLLQKMHEKELISYKQTICRLEENNRQMLEEINNLKEALELHQTGIALHIEASGAWTNADI
ncbi:PREDICTED: afadin- and alpha-actinin-binding protein-like [Trachymyrmex septentrionalis]|nr:PREDICTED: afadin- and alpha-actinin-binding protein-like [Trachymyrmex septentrionalis]XP_018354493.1 PREDICTED: afadin- and alpha-actinin-binding protein-like [Trachymyrmex septentrionalis]